MNRNPFFNLMIGIAFLLVVFSFTGCKKEKSAIANVHETDVSNKISAKITEIRIHDSSAVYSIETFHKDSKKKIDQLSLPSESCFEQNTNHLIDFPETFKGRIIVCISPKIGKTKVIICNGYSGKISEITSDLDTKDPELLKNFFNKGASLPQIIAKNSEILIKIKEPDKNISVYKLNKDTQEFEIDKNII